MRSRHFADRSLAHVALVIVAALAWPAARLASQSITVDIVKEAVRVRAPQLRFIDGEPLARLKDGQSVRVDLELSVLAKPGTAAVAQSRQSCILSYDLWEERFAVALSGLPSRSMSHLTAVAAQAWCLEQLAVPVSALGPTSQKLPFWIRLEYRLPNGDNAAERDDGGLTLRGLIDLLSRKPKAGEVSHSIEAGPFQVPE
jgi:hypothetical protein